MMVEVICPYCHYAKKISKDKIPSGAKWAVCPRCRQRFELPFSEERAGRGTGEGAVYEGAAPSHREAGGKSGRRESPWENRAQFGLWEGMYLTFKSVLFSPKSLFSTMTFKGGLREPLAFGLLIGAIGGMFEYFWPFLIFSGSLSILGPSVLSHVTAGLIFLFMLVVVPVLVILGLFLKSGIIHLLLLIVRGANNGYEATFRVVTYSQAAHAWGLIPLVGGLVGRIWKLTIQVIGLREIHETTYARVILAFLIPVFLVVVLLIAVLVPLFLYVQQHWLSQV